MRWVCDLSLFRVLGSAEAAEDCWLPLLLLVCHKALIIVNVSDFMDHQVQN